MLFLMIVLGVLFGALMGYFWGAPYMDADRADGAWIGASIGAGVGALAFAALPMRDRRVGKAQTVVPGRDAAEDTAATNGETERLVLKEEELDVRKVRVKTGEVVVRKEIVEEQRTIQVPVRREEVVIERQGFDGSVSPKETIRIPVKEERVDVVTYPVDLEEVSVYTKSVQEEEQVSALLRREVGKVELQGDPEAVIDETIPTSRS